MIDLDRLLTWLNQSSLQQTNNPLYQVIKTLIKAAQEFQKEQAAINDATSGSITGFENLDFLTHGDESSTLPNSRQLIAGVGITFDDTTVNQRTISASASSGVWMPLTDGLTPETQLIFDGFGSCIMVFVPQP